MHRSPVGTVSGYQTPLTVTQQSAVVINNFRIALYVIIATSYHHAKSASLDDRQLANHATHYRLADSIFTWPRKKERIDIPPGSDERELRVPLSVLVPAQHLAGSGELSF
jgi:hypothetical protein